MNVWSKYYSVTVLMLSFPLGECDGVSHSAVYVSAAERVCSRAPVRPTAVCAGLYAWQSNRLSQCLLLLDLQLACRGYMADVVSTSSLLAACLKCLVSMGQGMKEPIARIACLALDLSNTSMTGVHKTLHGQSALPLSLNKIPFSSVDDVAVTGHTDSACSAIGIDAELRSVLLEHLLGTEEEVNKALNFSDFSVLIQREVENSLNGPVNMADWKDTCIDTNIPVPRDWALLSLKRMEGTHFERWLDVLSTASVSKVQVKGEEEGEAKYSPLLSSVVDSLYGLLLLACPDQAFRWRILTADSSAEEIEGEWDCMVVNDCSDRLVYAYCALLGKFSDRIAREQVAAERAGCIGKKRERDREGEGEKYISHCEQFIAVSLKGVSSTHALASSVKNCGTVFSQAARAREGKSTFGAGVKAEAGTMDLCDKLLEALTSQVISQGKSLSIYFPSHPTLPYPTLPNLTIRMRQLGILLQLLYCTMTLSIIQIFHFDSTIDTSAPLDVHSTSVLCLLSPTLSPWRVREKVWRELGQLRLLHLLESESIIDSLLGLMECSAITMLQLRDSRPTVGIPSDSAIEHCSATSSTNVLTHAVVAADVPVDVTVEASERCANPVTLYTPTDSSRRNSIVNGDSSNSSISNSKSSKSRSACPGPLKTMMLVSKAILDSLCRLRSDEDQHWHIVSLGLYQVAASLFSVSTLEGEQGRALLTTNTAQGRMLVEVLQDVSVPDWTVTGVVLAAHCFFSGHRAHTGESEIESGVGMFLETDMLRKSFREYRQQRRLMDDSSSASPLCLVGSVLNAPTTQPRPLFVDEVLILFPKAEGEECKGEGKGEGRALSLRDVIAMHRPHLV